MLLSALPCSTATAVDPVAGLLVCVGVWAWSTFLNIWYKKSRVEYWSQSEILVFLHFSLVHARQRLPAIVRALGTQPVWVLTFDPRFNFYASQRCWQNKTRTLLVKVPPSYICFTETGKDTQRSYVDSQASKERVVAEECSVLNQRSVSSEGLVMVLSVLWFKLIRFTLNIRQLYYFTYILPAWPLTFKSYLYKGSKALGECVSIALSSSLEDKGVLSGCLIVLVPCLMMVCSMLDLHTLRSKWFLKAGCYCFEW